MFKQKKKKKVTKGEWTTHAHAKVETIRKS
jgi:hypothetical protein